MVSTSEYSEQPIHLFRVRKEVPRVFCMLPKRGRAVFAGIERTGTLQRDEFGRAAAALL